MKTDIPHHATRRRLAQILQSEQCTIASSVFDPVSARLAQHIGAECGVLGGSAAAQVILGAPDLILLTATELVEQSRRICRLNAIELIVDADHGYGNALNTMRTVEDLQAAGVAGIGLEDSRLPREFDSHAGLQLTSIEEHCAKLKAAVSARAQGSMLIFARTNALELTGIADTIARLQAYEKTGVDALFVPYLRSREELDALAQALTLPLILVAAHASLFDLTYLASRRVKVWMWGHQPLAHATTTLLHAMLAAQQGIAPDMLPTSADPTISKIATNAGHYQQLSEYYLQSRE